MNMQECIHYLEEEVGFASRPGLERIRLLCDKLGSPEKKLSVIHIAGTNGKGSAAAMLSSILTAAGYRTGTYTSPHLERYNERFLISGEEISDEDFCYEITLAKQACEELEAEGKDVPTLFEIITGAAFHYFARQNVDVLVLEVGLGGTFDATNVVEKPLLSLIMSISIDHTEFLGSSLERIAKEKAGIIKKNCPVVLYSQGQIVYNIVKTYACEKDAPFFCPDDAEISVFSQTLEGTVFSVHSRLAAYKNICLPLLGSYQISNCVTVLSACTVLRRQGLSLTEEAVRKGLADARWAGRMEICGRKPLVILDGAHNADGISRLAESLSVYIQENKATLILGVLGDKEYRKMAEEILPFARTAILTEPESHRRLDVLTLSRSISGFSGEIYLEKNLEKAYCKALSVTPENGVVLACGSLYMVGALRSFIKSLSPYDLKRR